METTTNFLYIYSFCYFVAYNDNFVFFVYFCSDDEDDTAELLAELQRIKKERAQEEMKKVNCVYNHILFLTIWLFFLEQFHVLY